MRPTPLEEVVRCLRHVCAAQEARDQPDTELLRRFVAQRDQAAFAALVRRHGPMVYGVCLRVLGNSHDAEDGFQATFFVLARRAASIGTQKPLGNWLYGVALRVAVKARAKTAARRQRERRPIVETRAELLDEVTWNELRGILDEEIGRLPEQNRVPIILCFLEGMSHAQAAKQLGCPKNTLTNRLHRGEELLRQQLVRRGIALSAAALTAALAEKASGTAVGAMLVISTVKAAMSFAGGKTAVGCISATAAALAEEAIKGMAGVKGLLAVMVLTLGIGIGGAGLAGYGAFVEQESQAKGKPNPPPPAKSLQIAPANKQPAATTDLYGDPLPKGAIARLGTERFRQGLGTIALAFSPDGKTLASTGVGSISACIWDVKTGRAKFRQETQGHVAVAYSPDGKMLALGGEPFLLIDAETGKELRSLEPGPGRNLFGASFSPDGQTLAGPVQMANASAVILWDALTGKVLRQLTGHTARVQWCQFSPDGKLVVSSSNDQTVRLWEVASGKEIRRFERNDWGTALVAFSPSGKVLATSTEQDGFIRLWEVSSGKLLHEIKADKGTLVPIAFSPDGKLLASSLNSGEICLWDPETGKEVRRWRASDRNHSALAFTPDGKTLASSGFPLFDHAIRFWDAATGKEINPTNGHTGLVFDLSFSEDSKALFSRSQDRRILEWDLATAKERRTIFLPMDVSQKNRAARAQLGITSFDLSPDGKLLAWTAAKEAGTDKPDCTIYLGASIPDKGARSLVGHDQVPDFLKFSPDGKCLISGDTNGSRLWEIATRKELYRLPETAPWGFSPDSKLLAVSGMRDKAIRLIQVATGKEWRRLDGSNDDGFDLLVFSPDGKMVAAAKEPGRKGAGQIQIWHTTDGKALTSFARLDYVDSLAFSQSGRVLAVSGPRRLPNANTTLEGTVLLWGVLSSKEIRQFETEQSRISALAFSPDGRSLATGGMDSTILVWDLADAALKGKAKPGPLTAPQLDGLWADLADEAPKADQAIWTLALAPKQSLPYLKVKLQPRDPIPAEKVAGLIADLDSERFAVRQKAAQALDAMGEAAELALRKTLKGKITLEARQRVELILENRNKDGLRIIRAIDALEQIGTRDAVQVLETLSQAAPNPRVVEAARAAVKRLSKGM